MQLDKLQIELRPRTNAQALDLGFAVLRAHALNAYSAWLALWLPWMALCSLLAWLMPSYLMLWLLLAWWFRPLFERAPLYVLSRELFGEAVGWREALRAWPRQLGGGALELLTWGRIFAVGRCLYQPVWQLELARGKVARARRRLLAQRSTGRSAYWFGIVCVHLEGVLQLGLFALASIFFSSGPVVNPFAILVAGPGSVLLPVLTVAGYALGAAIIGPIYTACGFTLYLNRRAALEAWDIEIALRQIVPPASARLRKQAGTVLPLLLCLVLAVALVQPAPAQAAPLPPACTPDPPPAADAVRIPAHDQAQARLRRDIDSVYLDADLRGYVCNNGWHRKDKHAPEQAKAKAPNPGWFDFNLLALIVKVALIAAAIGAAGWLLYRYRDRFPALARRKAATATEVGGLDIRASSLPADVAGAVRALWESGECRAALALLYRATLARLVEDDGLVLHAGATEGDCLRLAREAAHRQQLAEARLQVAAATTTLWLDGAYSGRWPAAAAVMAQCGAWQAQFGQRKEAA